jgi:hypothetical protein
MVGTTQDTAWPLGSLVIERGEELTRHAIRVVVGYRPDGRCMTRIALPPPWMPQQVLQSALPSRLRRIDETPVSLKGYTRSDCGQCPIRFACDGQGATAQRQCFMDSLSGSCAQRTQRPRRRRSLSERLRGRLLGLATAATASGMGAVG